MLLLHFSTLLIEVAVFLDPTAVDFFMYIPFFCVIKLLNCIFYRFLVSKKLHLEKRVRHYPLWMQFALISVGVMRFGVCSVEGI